MKLSTTFAILFSGIIFLMGAIAFYGIFSFQVDILGREISDKLEDAAVLQMDNLDRMFYERLNDLHVLSTNPAFAAKDHRAAKIRAQLEAFLGNYPQYVSVSYFTLDRIQVARAGIARRHVARHPLNEYWPAVYAGQSSIINISKSTSLQAPILHFVVRVPGRAGSTAGVLVARVPVADLYELIDYKTKPSADGVRYKIDMLDRHGVVLYSNHAPNTILERADKDFGAISQALVSGQGTARLNEARQEARAGEFGPDIERLLVAARERGYRDFPGNGWILKVQYANRDAFAPVAAMSKKILALLLFISVVGIAAILATLSFTVLRPIKKLNRATTRVALGELDARVPVERFDEIGKLGRSFNAMAANLKEAKAQLALAAETALARANLAERKIVSISEETQQQIGQELHDDLGQQLTGIAFMTEVLSQQLRSQGHASAASAAKITELINEAIGKTHRLAHGLYPVEMKELGLRAMLMRLAANTESIYQIECKFTCDGDISIASSFVTANLFRIAQEAVHNAVKHSGATMITVCAANTTDSITIEVADNGRGMGHFSDTEGGGLGMYTMRYRAALLGAQLQITTAAPGGTAIRVALYTHTMAPGASPEPGAIAG